eukprot:scaffold35157_cov24-Attheya_sp.AAC.1
MPLQAPLPKFNGVESLSGRSCYAPRCSLFSAAAGNYAFSCVRGRLVAARAIKDFYNKPQDIEWAIDENDTLFILQARHHNARKHRTFVVPASRGRVLDV